MFFSSTGLNALVAADNINKSAYSSASENWYKKFDMDWFRWTEENVLELIADFNRFIKKSGFTIMPEVAKALHYKCDGYLPNSLTLPLSYSLIPSSLFSYSSPSLFPPPFLPHPSIPLSPYIPFLTPHSYIPLHSSLSLPSLLLLFPNLHLSLSLA